MRKNTNQRNIPISIPIPTSMSMSMYAFKLQRIIRIGTTLILLLSISQTHSFSIGVIRRIVHHRISSSSSSPLSTNTRIRPPPTQLKSTPNPNDNSGNSNNNSDKNGRISPETIEEIKTYADIITVIESYNLPHFSRSSDGYRAKSICPFHNDRNPSLNIDNSRGIYKCFSCGAGGDVFNFVREYDFINGNGKAGKGEKMSYPAAIQKVASEFCGGALAQKVQSASGSYAYGKNGMGQNRTMTPERREKIQRQLKKRERILLANSAAADFYARNLIVNPTAGLARAHLNERGIVPAMVRTFALGFASDAYFHRSSGGNGGKKIGGGNKEAWGEGSLIQRLESLKFTPKEILDAGLATLTSRARSRLQLSSTGSSIMYASVQKNGTDSTKVGNATEANGMEYSDLMDRFRSRLMVPIFDVSGKNVIGFGGRHLEASKTITDDDDKTNGANKAKSDTYVAAKYLNTPETPVFLKKDILFGLHSASAAIDDDTAQLNPSSTGLTFESNVPTIVIVEGYFDAITLYGAGIKEVVASMGTALTTSQLKMAASALGNRGRIILCLDNDDAGLNAVERLCAGTGIWDFVENNGIEINVASLPDGIKDPADFIEAKGGASKITSGEQFRTDILDKAAPWNLWYISRLISKYDPNDSTSFSSVCEDVSTFLSTHRNAADRTRQAYEAAGKLAAYIAKDSGGSGDGPLKIQLESDLLSMASRKAAAKEAMARRIEAVDGDSNNKEQLARLYSGGPSIQDEQQLGLSVNRDQGKKGIRKDVKVQPNTQKSPPDQRRNMHPQQNNSFRQNNGRNMRYNQERQAPPLSRHFNGFQFSETDAAWLGITTEKAKQKFVLGGEPERGQFRKDLVYFNSNKYLGNERSVLSNIADKNSTDPVIEGTINPLMKPSANRLLTNAEKRLLQTMVHYPSARLAMKNALANRIGDENAFLEWTNPDREWLFQCLTDSPGHEQLPLELQDGGNAAQLKDQLRNRPDVPDNAFKTVPKEESSGIEDKDDVIIDISGESSDNEGKEDIIHTNAAPTLSDNDNFSKKNPVERMGMRLDEQNLEEKTINSKERPAMINPQGFPTNERTVKKMGTLDEFFIDDEELSNVELREGSASHEERAALTVQESVAVMLKATAMKKLNHLKKEWEAAISLQNQRKMMGSDEDKDSKLQESDTSIHRELSDDELEQMSLNLGQQVSEAMVTVRELTESSNALNQRLISYCAADGVEGRISLEQREKLAKALDEHLASLPDDPRPTTSGASDNYIFGSDDYDDSIDSRFGGIRPGVSQSSADEPEKSPAENIYDSIFE